MKQNIKNVIAKVILLFFGLLSGVYAMAQDGSASQTETNHTTVSHSQSTTAAPDATMWYANPIVWVIGGAVLLIIIILAVRGSNTTVVRDGGTSRTTTTTIRKE